MISLRHSFFVFPFAGLCSGVCSGMLLELRPCGLLLPPLLFGSAIANAFHVSTRQLSRGQQTVLIGASIIAYLSALASGAMCAGIPGFDNGRLSGALVGTIGGGVGALIVAFGIAGAIPTILPVHCLLIVTSTGAIFGALCISCGVYIADHTTLGHPLDFIASFVLWQTGVASAVPFCEHRSLAD